MSAKLLKQFGEISPITNQKEKLHFSYERFLENRLREEFDFAGSPIRFIQRVKERGNRERARRAEKRSRMD